MKSMAYCGLDVHADTVALHVVGAVGDAVLSERTFASDNLTVAKHLRRLAEKYDLYVCYEASSCGYVLHRLCTELGIRCMVVAPSLVPVRAGDRVKTDRRDARKLARLLRAGELTAVHVPTVEEESLRAAVRCREMLVREVAASKNHVLKFLRLRGLRFTGTRSNWTLKHWEWLRSLKFDFADHLAWQEYMGLLEFKQMRLAELDRSLSELVETSPCREAVKLLCCLRGIGPLSALTIVAETIDFVRFGSARRLMSWFGLTPSEHSSGGTVRKGAITKCGNAHCRRVLVEAAWKYMCKPAFTKVIAERQVGQPPDVVSFSMKAQHRLHKKFWNIALRKERQKAAVAVARELTGFIWALMTDNFGGRSPRTAAMSSAA